jgi:predicted enzyme related to lactoylglutathione lyase
MNKVVHFEIIVVDPERAMKFYTAVFGWEFKKWDGADMDYWMVFTTPPNTPGAINGGLRKEMGTEVKERTVSVNGFINTIAVDSIDDTLASVEKNGGEVLMPKQPVKDLGMIASCYDTEGNVFSLMQPDK